MDFEKANASFSPHKPVNDKLAEAVFDLLPEDGAIMAVLDRQGAVWASDRPRFQQYARESKLLDQLCTRVDDGWEPAVCQLGGAAAAAILLDTERLECGYLLLILPDYTQEAALANMDLIEMLLHQTALIANLLDARSCPAPARG